MSRIGFAISSGANPAEIVDLVVLAESLGCASAWVAEGHGGDRFAILAAGATRTSRIRLGTSISILLGGEVRRQRLHRGAGRRFPDECAADQGLGRYARAYRDGHPRELA